jgi:hypothetical protein
MNFNAPMMAGLKVASKTRGAEQEIAMFQVRRVVLLLMVMTLLPGMLVAQYRNDEGQYTILSAQYGTARRHVDVTRRLKELARSDRQFRMGNSTFGVDPDPGQRKVLRIYARDPNGRERMFEYPEGATVDGTQFRGWGRGDWGEGRWSGRWEGQDQGYQGQPNMNAAIQNLREAQRNLEAASPNKGGHRERAMQLVDQAIREVEAGIQYDNTH